MRGSGHIGLGPPPPAKGEATALVLEQVADGEALADEIKNGWIPILARKVMAST